MRDPQARVAHHAAIFIDPKHDAFDAGTIKKSGLGE